MRIYMIGSGAMGSFYGGLLSRAGFDVTLIDIRVDHIGRIQRDGLIVEGVRGRHVINLPARTDYAGLPPGDLAIVFNQQDAHYASDLTIVYSHWKWIGKPLRSSNTFPSLAT